jgi:hypothetical protein
MDGVTKLLKVGMKMLAKIEKRMDELATAQKELAAAQKNTERTLQAFIAASKNGKHRNGN